MPELRQTIRFCRADDGVRLAYSTMGKGPPLVRAAHYLTHLEYDLRSPLWRPWLTELSRHHTLVRYDPRGCGLSDRETGDLSLDRWVADLEAVVDAAGLGSRGREEVRPGEESVAAVETRLAAPY
jgi:pimeloyl-ACP methyl ester carboxylesterase